MGDQAPPSAAATDVPLEGSTAIVSGYVTLGVLVGLLTGLSSSPVASAVLAAIFAFAGGSAAHVISQQPQQRLMIGTVLLWFSMGAVAGLFGGIVIKENRLLTSITRLQSIATSGIATEPYVKGVDLDEVRAINAKYRAGDINAADAYEKLLTLIEKK